MLDGLQRTENSLHSGFTVGEIILRNSIRLIFVLFAWCCVTGHSLATDKHRDEVQEILELHNMEVVVAIGRYYLKQETLLAVRKSLFELGESEKFGSLWNNSNPHWKNAEEKI